MLSVNSVNLKKKYNEAVYFVTSSRMIAFTPHWYFPDFIPTFFFPFIIECIDVCVLHLRCIILPVNILLSTSLWLILRCYIKYGTSFRYIFSLFLQTKSLIFGKLYLKFVALAIIFIVGNTVISLYDVLCAVDLH